MKLNLRTVLVLVLLTTSLSIIYQNLPMQLLLICFTLILYGLTGMSRETVLKIWHRLKKIGQIIITLMIFQILFRRGGDIYWQYGILQITSAGVSYGVISSLRFLLIILIAGLLFDYPYYDYLLSFRSWKIPFEISFMVATIIHFIPIFGRQFTLGMEALALRGIVFKKIPLLTRIRMFISLIFPVFAKALYNVRYRAISLELRGFRLYPDRTYLYSSKLKLHDILIQISGVLFFIIILSIYN